MSTSNNQKTKTSICLIWTLFSFFAVTVITLAVISFFNADVTALQKINSQKLGRLIAITEQQLSQSQGSSILPANFKKEILDKNEDNYQTFWADYYKVQSNWLNAWLTILAVFLGSIGIIAPILLAQREEKIEKIKSEANAVKDEIKKDIETVAGYVKKTEASVLLTRAIQFFQFENYNEAIKYCNKALILNTNDAEIYNFRGTVYINAEDYSAGINDYKKVIELDSNQDYIYYNLSEAYILNEQFEQALETLNQYLQTNKKHIIFSDDYASWLQILNKYPDNSIVPQIIELVEKKLTKKTREEIF